MSIYLLVKAKPLEVEVHFPEQGPRGRLVDPSGLDAHESADRVYGSPRGKQHNRRGGWFEFID